MLSVQSLFAAYVNVGLDTERDMFIFTSVIAAFQLLKVVVSSLVYYICVKIIPIIVYSVVILAETFIYMQVWYTTLIYAIYAPLGCTNNEVRII